MQTILPRAWLTAAWCTLALTANATGQPISFNAPRVFPATPSPGNGSNIAAIVSADFNGDGKPDLATIYGGQVSLLLNLGGGIFQTNLVASRSGGGGPAAMATGDFNQDGNVDLVVSGGDAVAVLLGNGDGTFQSPRISFAGQYAGAMAVGDFNGDGIPDLAVINAYNSVAILLGRGDGSFGPATIFPAGTSPVSVVTADFNGDGKPDLAVADYGAGRKSPGAVVILLGNGDGTFQAAVPYGSGIFGVLVAGDFNNDGKVDLAVARTQASSVSILLGNGDGTLRIGAHYKLSASPVSLVTGDFNGDGKLDLAASTGQILLGNGDGAFHFAAQTFQPANTTLSFLATADFNGDGTLDLAAALPFNFSPGILILLGSGHARFQQTVTLAPPGGPAASIVTGDFNGDGNLDLAVSNNPSTDTGSTVSILFGDGHGNFAPGGTYNSGPYPTALAVADFNNDGKPDLAVANYDRGSGGFSVLLGNGDGTFQSPISYVTGDFPGALIVADFNGDGKPDVLVNESYDNAFFIFFGNGDGTFQPPAKYTFPNLGSAAVGDFNGDGIPDLALSIVPGFNGALVIWLGKGDGTFTPGVTYTNVPFGDMAVADVNDDGYLDLVMPGATFLGNGDGTFQPPSLASNAATSQAFLADFNGDGKLDLVSLEGIGLGVELGNGDGTFQAPTYYANFGNGGYGVSLTIRDFNRDGKPDVATTSVSVFTNTTR